MIYNLLREYRQWLEGVYAAQTAETYYKRLSNLFEGQPLTDTTSRLDIDKVMEILQGIKYKNHFSQTKNAFLHFCKFQNINLSVDTLMKIRQLERDTKKKHRRIKPIDFNEVDKTINHIKNKKLKLCFQVMMATGLRVSEISSITKDGCIALNNNIAFNFVAKGGEKDTIILLQIEYLELTDDIKELIMNAKADKKIFYSAVYLQMKAKEHGFTCHDLRRIFARLEYKKCGSKVEVAEKMRHTNIKNTSRYLRCKIKF